MSSVGTPDVRGRIAWIDTCKGLGISVVVLGHCLNTTSPAREFIYTFHMPLFFFLSGYLHAVKSDIKQYWKRKAVHLLLPYAAFLLLFLPRECIHAFRHGEGVLRCLASFLWGGQELRADYGVFWFLTCLFLTQQVGNYLLLKLKPSLVALTAVPILGLGYVVAHHLPPWGFAFNSNVVLVALPLFLAGYGFKRSAKYSFAIQIAAVSGVAITAIMAVFRPGIAFDMKYSIYGVPFLSVLLSLSCIVGLFIFSERISHFSGLSRFFGALGASSLGIMCVHEIVVTRISSILPVWLTFPLALTVAYFITVILSRFRFTRAVFLGDERDYRALKGAWMQDSQHATEGVNS